MAPLSNVRTRVGIELAELVAPPRPDSRQVGDDRDGLQRREGEEKDEVSKFCILIIIVNCCKGNHYFFLQVHHVRAATGGDDGGRLREAPPIQCTQGKCTVYRTSHVTFYKI